MSSCEKCWRDAGGDPDKYHHLITIRTGDRVCTPEEQAGGKDAGWCDICNRQTIHLYTKKCTNFRSDEHLREYELAQSNEKS